MAESKPARHDDKRAGVRISFPMPYTLVYRGHEGLCESPAGDISEENRSAEAESAGSSGNGHDGGPSEGMMATVPEPANPCEDGSIAFSDRVRAMATRRGDEGSGSPPAGSLSTAWLPGDAE